MQRPIIQTAKDVVPMIYAYTTPEIARHDGWTKIGYTEQDVETRIKQQTHTADIKFHVEWRGNALYEDGSGERFTDKDFHAYLRRSGVEQEEGTNNEWFHISGSDSRLMFFDFKEKRGQKSETSAVIPYKLRQEQQDAVAQTLAYRASHNNGEFLWNAKPRFGKTLSVYDFCKQAGAKTVLIVTNRPAIANSWYEDYMKFLGRESGYIFVSEVEGLKGKEGVLSRAEYNHLVVELDDDNSDGKCIEFVSLQDMKGSKYFSNRGIDKLREVADMDWDVLVIDEAHEGVDTYKTDVAFDRIKRHFTLHLSGTPFKALANNKFAEDAIYNWTYADEQAAKRDWDVSAEEENPYEKLPRLNLFTYQMSEIIRDKLQHGIEVNDETEAYAFDLNEFFSTNVNKSFVHDESVDKFLDALTMLEKYPFSTPELRDELKHTFWLMDRVDSAKAMAHKLKNHPVFKDYEIILAAGDGKLDEKVEIEKAYDRVRKAIAKYDKTITLSVGQLTTGVTIEEWTAVLMLSNVKSPALYMQAAFRAQNPCMFKKGTHYARKENAYVFDFDPARTLTIFEEFANDLSADTSAGRGDLDTRKAKVRELLNFFPVIGEDENGELIELDAEKVLTIPRKIRSVEVVRRGFMSNFLFQNISQVFGAPQAVLDIINQFEAVKEQKKDVQIPDDAEEDLSLNDEGNVEVSDDIVIGVSKDIFGSKVYAPETDVVDVVDDIVATPEKAKRTVKDFIKTTKEQLSNNLIAEAKEHYGNDMKQSDKLHLEKRINNTAENTLRKTYTNYEIEKNIIEQDRQEALQSRHDSGRTSVEINREFDAKIEEANTELKVRLKEDIDKLVEDSQRDIVKTVETSKRESEKSEIENDIRDHLRGFSRTIPSFLMAYGDEAITLENFDQIIPDEVFKEVTSITLDQFRFLRDGGPYTDSKTNEKKYFMGQLFDPVVFNDSVKEFLATKKRLANYFDEEHTEDIFDYIPPQKTNQIFTPKKIVKRMVEALEEENPGCFNQPDKTFLDPYMKSGLFITEIVKRLYRSEAMKQLYPDGKARLQHIFEKQMYGLAPTEIIYRIATSYILGFDEDLKIENHNFRQVDALPYVKEGTLQQKLDELYDN